jgi:hypothetical protein
VSRALRRAAIALALPVTLLGVPRANAAEVCVQTNTFNYSPPLGLQSTSGQMSGTHSNLCANDALQFYTRNGLIGASYTGNCVLAFFGANTISTVLLGGTVHVMVDLDGRKSKVLVMTTDGYCPTSRATGTGPWVDA